MNARSYEKIMLAAAAIEPGSFREAAIVGGIVNCLCKRKELDYPYIAHAAVAGMEWAQRQMLPTQLPALLPNVSLPTTAEVVAVVHKFRNQYEPPSTVAA